MNFTDWACCFAKTSLGISHDLHATARQSQSPGAQTQTQRSSRKSNVNSRPISSGVSQSDTFRSNHEDLKGAHPRFWKGLQWATRILGNLNTTLGGEAEAFTFQTWARATKGALGWPNANTKGTERERSRVRDRATEGAHGWPNANAKSN